ncbi:MAG TPA: Hsp33 family molecular chaperone HslO [Balneolales bacterium]|nr:Hsp33 family molecular chaperone HslO [Balneolales bacterium]
MINKEEFLNKDRIIKGISKDGYFKISAVKTTDVVKEAKRRHGLSLLNTVILGRALTGVMLLASELKGEERVQLRIEGDGPIGLLKAEANSAGEIRGFVEHPEAELDYTKTSDLGDGLGDGTLSFSKILYNEARPLTGIVHLINGNISDDLVHYLLQSDQIPSAMTLDVQIDKKGEVMEAGGILIQAMPGAPENKIQQLEENLAKLSKVGLYFNDDKYIDELMVDAMVPYEVKELERYPVHFFCRCSKDRFKDALAMISLEDLKDFEEEGQELVCHYCNEHYYITKEEIEEIVTQTKIKMN